MDPALRELAAKRGEAEVEAILRLEPGAPPPAGVRVVARFGEIATVRLAREAIAEVWAAEEVASLKAARPFGPDPLPETTPPAGAGGEDTASEAASSLATNDTSDGAALEDPELGDRRRPPGLAETGRGVIVALVDWGCDFAHPNLLSADGSTRVLALWDQSAPGPSPQPYGYGRVYERAEIDRALRTDDPYAALGYHPASGDPSGRGAHGTHVADIAAGNGRAEGAPVGIAPEAELLFVHLATRGTGGRASLGDSVTLLEALDWISLRAGDRPWVINLSVGRHGGPHNGLTLVEQGIDELLRAARGRALVQSAGNYFDAEVHASGQLRPGERRVIGWWTGEADLTPNELEVWYPGRDRLGLEIKAPGDAEPVRVPLGGEARLMLDGREVGRAYHRAHDPAAGDNHVDVFLDPRAPFGRWEITLVGEAVVDGRFHAWVERDPGCPDCQSRLDPDDADPRTTHGTLASAFRSLAVGAYDAHQPGLMLGHFSSSGPTRDGRVKPDLVAPGVDVLAARSTGRDLGFDTPLLTRFSGTSMAAPHVTGTVALMFQAAGRPLDIEETRSLLLGATRPVPEEAGLAERVGSGVLDVEAAVAAARGVVSRAGEAEAMAVEAAAESSDDNTLPVAVAVEDETMSEELGETWTEIAAESAVESAADRVGESFDERRGCRCSGHRDGQSEASFDEGWQREPGYEAVDESFDELGGGESDLEGWRELSPGDLLLPGPPAEAFPGEGFEERRRCSCGGHHRGEPRHEAAESFGAGEADEAALAVEALLDGGSGAAAALFDTAVFAGELAEAARWWEVVALPGEGLAAAPLSGDVLVTRALGEGSIASARQLASEGLAWPPALPHDQLLLRPRLGGSWDALDAEAVPAVLPPPRGTTVTTAGANPDLSVPCPPPPLVMERFDFDRDRPKPAHRAQIATLAQTIVDSQTAADPVHSVCIVGHTDDQGDESYNQDLAARRAISVSTELETEINTRRPGLLPTLGWSVQSRGEESPQVPNDSAANRARNRRVEVFVNRRWLRTTPAVGACPVVAVAADSPTAPTPFAVGEDTFSATISLFGGSLPVSGTVFYPAETAGTATPFATALATPVPVVVLAHGNHATFRHPTDRFRESCGPGGGFVPLANHKGYDYLQRLLAGMGIVTLSVDANATNCVGNSPTNIQLRGALILAALQHFLNLHTGAGSRFSGRLDLGKTALLGHSRGGEAVLVAAETLPTVPSLAGARILGVISLAPTDARATSGRPNGFAYMAMLPAADGDVVTNDGAKFYDQAVPSPFKCQVYLHGGNHNFFNRNWPLDEGHGAVRLSRTTHEEILSAYACAFFRAVLLGHNTLRFLRQDVLPPGIPIDKVQVSFEAGGVTTVDDHENRNISVNALGQPTTQAAGLTAAEFDFQQGLLSSFNRSFFGKTVGMVAQTAAAGGLFRSQLPAAANLTNRELWVRVAEVYNGTSVPSLGTGYQIGVEDSSGSRSFADSNDVGGLPRPFDRRADDLARVGADLTKTMLRTHRFSPACFVRPGFDITQVRAVLLRLDRGDGRAIAFDQLQIV